MLSPPSPEKGAAAAAAAIAALCPADGWVRWVWVWLGSFLPGYHL